MNKSCPFKEMTVLFPTWTPMTGSIKWFTRLKTEFEIPLGQSKVLTQRTHDILHDLKATAFKFFGQCDK